MSKKGEREPEWSYQGNPAYPVEPPLVEDGQSRNESGPSDAGGGASPVEEVGVPPESRCGDSCGAWLMGSDIPLKVRLWLMVLGVVIGGLLAFLVPL